MARLLCVYFQSCARQSEGDESRDAGSPLGDVARGAVDSRLCSQRPMFE